MWCKFLCRVLQVASLRPSGICISSVMDLSSSIWRVIPSLLQACNASITAHAVPLFGVLCTTCPFSVIFQLRKGESSSSMPRKCCSASIESRASAWICLDFDVTNLENLLTLRSWPFSSRFGIPRPPFLTAMCVNSVGIVEQPSSFGLSLWWARLRMQGLWYYIGNLS